jgi:uncharacterized protein
LRVVLDTGVVLSALLFPKGRLTWLVDAWKEGAVVPLVSRETVKELVRALAYPKFALEPEEIEMVLGEYLPWTQQVERSPPASLPRCRDPEDQKLVELAAAGEAELLVSGDGDLLDLRAVGATRIVKPARLAALLERGR